MSYLYSNFLTENQQQNKQQAICAWDSICARPCKRRNCTCLSCREAWAKKESSWLFYAHRRMPFTHRLRFTLFKDKPSLENVSLMRKVIRQTSYYARKHGLTFDVRLFPEQHGQSALHYHGIARMSDACVLKLRQFWREIGRKQGSYSIKLLDNADTEIAYACGWNYQSEINSVKSEKRCKKVVIYAGNAYRLKWKETQVMYNTVKSDPLSG